MNDMDPLVEFMTKSLYRKETEKREEEQAKYFLIVTGGVLACLFAVYAWLFLFGGVP